MSWKGANKSEKPPFPAASESFVSKMVGTAGFEPATP